MRNCINETEKIVIHTDSVGNIDPVGLNIFRYNLGSLVKQPTKFVFTGEKASYFTETWSDSSRLEFELEKERPRNYQNRMLENICFIEQARMGQGSNGEHRI
jgi:hypothetical protein